MLYSKSSVRSEPALQSLVHLPSDSLRSEMAAFLLDYIFTDSEDYELNVRTGAGDIYNFFFIHINWDWLWKEIH